MKCPNCDGVGATRSGHLESWHYAGFCNECKGSGEVEQVKSKPMNTISKEQLTTSMNHYYFISYAGTDPNGKTGFGNMTKHLQFGLTLAVEISEIETELKKQYNRREVTILFYQLLNKPK